MRRRLLPVAIFSLIAGVAVCALGEPPPPRPASVGVSLGASTKADKAAPAASANVSFTGAATPPAANPSSAAQGDAKTRGSALYSPAITKGHAAYLARDYAGAAQAYKEAIAKDPGDSSAYYFLSEAQIASGALAEADASLGSGLRSVGNKDDLHGKLLFVVADLRERQGRWADAKKAWEEYAQFLATHPGAKGYAATATERVKIVDARADLDAKYAPVRQRIEDRNKENANVAPAPDAPSAPASSPPAAKKK